MKVNEWQLLWFRFDMLHLGSGGKFLADDFNSPDAKLSSSWDAIKMGKYFSTKKII